MVRMRRRTKELIATIALVVSLFGIVALIPYQMLSDQTASGIAILVLGIICLVSMAALITFSRTGWKVEGSPGEWAVAIGLNPINLLFWNKHRKEQLGDMEKEERERDDGYYRRRDG